MDHLALCLCLVSACSGAYAATGQESLIILEDTTVIGVPYEPPVTQTRLSQRCDGLPVIQRSSMFPRSWVLSFRTVSGETHFGYGRPSREAAEEEWRDFCSPRPPSY